MSFTAFLAPIICLLGLMIFALSGQKKVQDLGFAMFCCGLLVFLFRTATTFSGHL